MLLVVINKCDVADHTSLNALADDFRQEVLGNLEGLQGQRHSEFRAGRLKNWRAG